MNYTINETFELSGYTAVIKTDQNLSGLLSDKFGITIRDTLSNVITDEINRHNISEYGVSDTTSLNTDEWAPRSCIKNGGVYVNINGDTITYKQTIPCVRNSDSENIGRNSSEITIKFFDENPDIEFYSKTLPFFQRSLPEKVNDTPDPILEPTSARPDYDFDYRHDEYAQELSTMAKISKNFNYNSVGNLYVNNDNGHIKKYNKNEVIEAVPNLTPKYKTGVSAYYSTTTQTGILEPNIGGIDSYIWNEKTDEKSEIPYYDLLTEQTDTIEFFDCTANLIYTSLDQYIDDSKFGKGYRENVVGLKLGFINHGIAEVIFQRVIITSTPDEDDPTVIHFTITNPHDSTHPCYLKPMAYVAKFANKAVQEDSSELRVITPSNIVDKSEVDGTITFDITDIDPTCPWTYVIDAWIDASIENYNSNVVKNKTIAREGPKQNPESMNAGFKPITISYKIIKQTQGTNQSISPSRWDDIQNSYNTFKGISGNDITDQIPMPTLDEDEYAIIKFKVHNPNWNNTKFVGNESKYVVNVSEILNKLNIASATLYIDETNPTHRLIPVGSEGEYDRDDPTVQYTFYVYNVKLNHEIQTAMTSKFTINVEVKSTYSEEFKCAWSSPSSPTTVEMVCNVPTVILPVVIYTCGEGDTSKCYKYQGKNKSDRSTWVECTTSHELNEIYDANKVLDTQESEYGWQDFKLLDTNAESVRRADHSFELNIESDGSQKIQRMFMISNGTISIIERQTDISKFILYDAIDTSRYFSDGIIKFSICDIVPQVVSTTCDAYSLNTVYNPTSVHWTSKKFIPDDWDFFKDFTVFTQSKLSLLGAYVGVKSLYCTALEATNNSFIDNAWVNPETGESSRIYIDGDGPDVFDGQYKIKLMTNTNQNPSNSFRDFMGDKYGNGIGDAQYKIAGDYITGQAGTNIHYSKNAHASFAIASENYTEETYPYNTTVVAQNTNMIHADIEPNSGEKNISEAIPVINKKPGSLPTLDVNYDNPTTLPTITSNYTFDANGGTQVFDKLETTNGTNDGLTITFKPGEYVFDHITVANDIRINIDCDGSKGEYVRLIVKNKATFGARLAILNVNDSFMTFMIYSEYESSGDDDNAIYFEAGRDPNIDDKFNYGVLVAPYGKVHFANGDNFWSGAIWAKSLSLSNGVAFIGRGDFA